jgi:hypothetical protein
MDAAALVVGVQVGSPATEEKVRVGVRNFEGMAGSTCLRNTERVKISMKGICACTKNCGDFITRNIIDKRQAQLAKMPRLKKRVVYFELSGCFNGHVFEPR